MRNLLGLGLAVAAVATAGTAQAAPSPSINFASNSSALPSYTTATVFESFTNSVGNGNEYTAAQAPVGDPYAETITGTVRTYNTNVPNDATGAPLLTGQYLAVGGAVGNPLGAGSFTVNFGTGVQFFSFALASLDLYNTLTLNFSDGTQTILNGGDIIGTAGAGLNPVSCPNGNCGVNGRVSYDLGGQAAITSATFTSTSDAFEIDDLAAAVPEPATWALMILGFGFVGAQLRSRRRSTKVSFA